LWPLGFGRLGDNAAGHCIGDDFPNLTKVSGFDVKALRAIVWLRKHDTDERREQQAILETYMHALGMD
jgi:uncharacterized protein (UPF0335 family)